jgi:hypothetical protein
MTSFLRGALVSYAPSFGVPAPNVIVFQFNPETITHELHQATSAGGAGAGTGAKGSFGGDPLASSGLPPETFSFTLVMNADSDLPGVAADPLAATSGIYSRLAALEMLLFPATSSTASGLAASVSSSLSSGSGGGSGAAIAGGSSNSGSSVPIAQVPTVLFVWGAGRIVPVRVASLNISEKLYDAALNPTYAEAQIHLTVLTPQDLKDLGTDPIAQLGIVAYQYTQTLRQSLALANLANAAQAQSIIGMIP